MVVTLSPFPSPISGLTENLARRVRRPRPAQPSGLGAAGQSLGMMMKVKILVRAGPRGPPFLQLGPPLDSRVPRGSALSTSPPLPSPPHVPSGFLRRTSVSNESSYRAECSLKGTVQPQPSPDRGSVATPDSLLFSGHPYMWLLTCHSLLVL